MRDRLVWVDYLKTIGILAVILGHIASPFSTFVFSWHMPLFFLIAGFFLDTNLTLKAFVKKDSVRLLLPYFLFALIGLGVELLKRVALNREELDILAELIGIFWHMDMTGLMNTYGFVLWFLPTLFLARLVVYFVLKMRLPFQICVVTLSFIISFYIEAPFALDNALNSLFFVFVGYQAFQYLAKGQHTVPSYSLFFGALAVVLLMWIYYGIPGLDLANKVYSQPIVNIIWALLVIALLVTIFQKVKLPEGINRINAYWASNTMIVFIIHPYTNNVGYLMSSRYFESYWLITFMFSTACLVLLVFVKVWLEQKKGFRFYV